MGGVLQMTILSFGERALLENQLLSIMLGGFDEIVFATWEWLKTAEAQEAFLEQNRRLTTFFNTSGIADKWSDIIESRASSGINATEYIYEYARKVNMEDYLVPYTATETNALNMLCDSNYELIRNVTLDEVTAIRRQLVQDFAQGTYPLQTSLKELQLKPINGWSPQKRAEVIARTETARAWNTSTLETYRNEGVEMVVLYGCDSTCDICSEYFTPTPIDEALAVGVPHPNCTGDWVSAENAPEPPKPGEDWTSNYE